MKLKLKTKALYLIYFLDHASGTKESMYFKAVGWFVCKGMKKGKTAYAFTTWKASGEDKESFDDNLELFTLLEDVILKVVKLRES